MCLVWFLWAPISEDNHFHAPAAHGSCQGLCVCRREIDLRKRGRCWYCVFGVIYCPRAQQSAAEFSMLGRQAAYLCVISAPLSKNHGSARVNGKYGKEIWTLRRARMIYVCQTVAGKRENLTMLMPNLWLSLHCAPVASKGGCFPEIMLAARPDNSMQCSPQEKKRAHPQSVIFEWKERKVTAPRAKHWRLYCAWLIVERAFSFFLYIPRSSRLWEREIYGRSSNHSNIFAAAHTDFDHLTWPRGSVQISKNEVLYRNKNEKREAYRKETLVSKYVVRNIF